MKGFGSQMGRLGARSTFLRVPERGKNPPFSAPGAVPHFLHLRTPVPRMQSSGQAPGSSSIPLSGKIAPGQGKGAVGGSGTDNSKGKELESGRSPSFTSRAVKEVVPWSARRSRGGRGGASFPRVCTAAGPAQSGLTRGGGVPQRVRRTAESQPSLRKGGIPPPLRSNTK